jgi:hypothetical protein
MTERAKSIYSIAAHTVSKHPYIAAGLLCLLTVFLGFGEQSHFQRTDAIVVWLAGCLGWGLVGHSFRSCHIAVGYLLWTGACVCLLVTLRPAMWFSVAGIPLCIILWLFLLRQGQLTDRLRGILLCGMGFCLRFAYILATPYYVRQHDVGLFDSDSGHAAYITYLYNNLRLPDFDVREVWQFYHPPLHHAIAAVWMRLLTFCGVSFENAGECVQILTLTYSCLLMVIFYQLLRHFRIHGISLSVSLGLIAFHPTFIIMSGSINNDILSITFMLASLLLTVKWYRNPRFSTILKLAFSIGCGMMTKLSAWMAAPAAALVFLVVLYRNRKCPFPFLRQFTVFGSICIPLGLWWGIRNFIRWGVPIAYMPMLSTESEQFVGNLSIAKRLLDFSFRQWTYVYDCFTMYGQSYNEYNPLIGLLKTALFDERIGISTYPQIAGFGELLFAAQAILALLGAAAMIRICRQKAESPDSTEKSCLCLTYGITLLCYYLFCLVYAHTCTQNIRYATPLIFISCLFLGLSMQSGGRHSHLRQWIIAIPSAVFMAASFAVYTCVSM